MLLVDTALEGEGTGGQLAQAVDEVLTMAQDMGGSMEYVHGVGVKLAHLVPRELGAGMEVLRGIKAALDPHNIMNPGKLAL
jgi:glycolate oxidase